MKHLVLLLADGDELPWDTQTPEEQGATMQRFEDFRLACHARPGVQILAGEALAGPSAASTLRTRGGQLTITEGPSAEAIEGLGGFYLIESPNLDTLVELVQELPAYDMQILPVIDPYE
ncbi:YciI family protein [Actinomycetota bacterium]